MKATTARDHSEDVDVTVRRARAARKRRLLVIVPDAWAHVDAVERALIAFVLERTNGNRTHAARFLGLSRSALIYRMHKHGLARSVPGSKTSERQ